MMKIKTLLIAFAAILLPAAIHAAGNAASSAAEVLRQAADALKKAPSVEASFSATSGTGAASGTITLAGNRFKLSTADLTTWFDGKTQWAYSPAADEVNISEPTTDELRQINPFAVIAGMQTDYTPRRLKSSAGTDRIELTPKTASEYRKIIVTFNDATKFPEEINVTSVDNSTTKIIIKSIRKGQKLPASTFRFDPAKYPNAEIVDLR